MLTLVIDKPPADMTAEELRYAVAKRARLTTEVREMLEEVDSAGERVLNGLGAALDAARTKALLALFDASREKRAEALAQWAAS